MAIEDASPAAPPESAEVAGGTEQLRALLTGYAEVLETIDDAAPVLWARPERPPILRWLRFPASRALVRTLVVRHITRCVNALKRYGARRVALADGAPGPVRELKMLESFEQSLPTARRLTHGHTLVRAIRGVPTSDRHQRVSGRRRQWRPGGPARRFRLRRKLRSRRTELRRLRARKLW